MKKTFSENNPYVEMMYTEFKDWSFDETASDYKGLWRKMIFNCSQETPLDLEIGTGNGTHFAKLAAQNEDRMLLGLELKFKTLVQSIRRCLKVGATNARMARFRAEALRELFEAEEINNVFIYFPDPWPKKRQNKNRLIQKQFLDDLYVIMRPGSFVDFKTDDYGYFQWAVYFFRQSFFELNFYSEDLHHSYRKDKNFITHFESLFIKKGQPIYYCRLQKK